MTDLIIYNSLTRKKEIFKPIHEGKIGMYVCGPTVYSDVHLGNCLTFVNFDIIYRYLKYLGYKVRYVRNITDVGHLVDDVDIGGEDKISKKARLEAVEPMEIVQRYTKGFHQMMDVFNTLSPNIEPRATGHILEQIEMVQQILDNGLGYIKNGSVYFNTIKFAKGNNAYGRLSGRIIDDLLTASRDDLKHQDEKNHPSDFAIWIKADESHIMRWPSPWSVGFPGWHLECSAMSTKYLGKTFDIHGGGSDLKFPHHENEIAQNYGACQVTPANYWLHTNMLLMNSHKMSKRDNNSITPEELFTGNSEHVSKAYDPMVLRFFMLQSHYRSTLDLTDTALQAAEKGYRRLMEAAQIIDSLVSTNASDGQLDIEMTAMMTAIHQEMNDDFNTPKALARIFELVSKINALKAGHLSLNDISITTLALLKKTFKEFIFDIFGLKDSMHEAKDNNGTATLDGLMKLIIDIRQSARTNKDWTTSDKIRDTLNFLEIQLKDGKDGTSWVKG